MFFSIIVPCFNSEKTIIRTLKSISKQTFQDYELIIVDDGSIDLTAQLVEDFCKDNIKNYKYIYQDNAGPSSARNNAVEYASGKYLAFLDADDEWHPEKLKIQSEVIQEHGYKFISANYVYDSFNSSKESYTVNKYGFFSFLFSNKTSTPCTVVLKELFKEVGGFPKNQRYSEDYNLWLKISYKEPLYKISTPLVKLNKPSYGYTGLSANLYEMEKYELKNYVELYNENKIGSMSLRFFQFISIIKFIRRVLLVLFRTK